MDKENTCGSRQALCSSEGDERRVHTRLVPELESKVGPMCIATCIAALPAVLLGKLAANAFLSSLSCAG